MLKRSRRSDKKNSGQQHFQRGFTMLELMVTLVIIAILVALGVPAVSDWTQRAQVRSETQRYVGILSLARSTAITQNQIVSVSIGAIQPDMSPFIEVRTDNDADGVFEEVVRRYNSEPTTLNLVTVPANVAVVNFDANGRLLGLNALQLDIENRNQNLGRIVDVNAIGRVTVSEKVFN